MEAGQGVSVLLETDKVTYLPHGRQWTINETALTIFGEGEMRGAVPVAAFAGSAWKAVAVGNPWAAPGDVRRAV